MKYRKKPVEIEAIEWTGKNYDDIQTFTNGKVSYYEWFQYNESGINEDMLQIPTLEGKMHAKKGDYIIKGIKGEFYPCKPDIFEQTYEKID
jgi:hypothetical protein